MAVLENFVKLVPGVPKRLHFVDHTFVGKTIRDPLTKWPKRVKALVFKVDWEDGMPVDKIFSVIEEKLASALYPYLDGKIYRDYIFEITKIGSGFTAEFRVNVLPWPRA